MELMSLLLHQILEALQQCFTRVFLTAKLFLSLAYSRHMIREWVLGHFLPSMAEIFPKNGAMTRQTSESLKSLDSQKYPLRVMTNFCVEWPCVVSGMNTEHLRAGLDDADDLTFRSCAIVLMFFMPRNWHLQSWMS